MKSEQIEKRIFDKDVASLLQNMLQQPVLGLNGTATYCKIDGVDVCAKTGTTDENYDRWLCGFTPYYTAVTWFGFDQNETINFNQRNPAGLIWTNVMHRIHSGKVSTHFNIDKNLQAYRICSKTGLRARNGCSATYTYTEYYLKGTVPGACTMHSGNELEKVIETNEIETTKTSTINKIIESINTEIDAIEPQDVIEEPEVPTPPPEEKKTEAKNEMVENTTINNVNTNTANNTVVENKTTNNTTNNTSTNKVVENKINTIENSVTNSNG